MANINTINTTIAMTTPSNVEIVCKSLRKSPCKTLVNLPAFYPLPAPIRGNLHFSSDFSPFFHRFSHRSSTLSLSYFFHFFAPPTTITTNNFIERIS